jgi:general secretion pathway protein G
VPLDPWGFPYKYTAPSTQGGEFEIISFGADGTPGGEGKNADVVSWDLDRN